MRAAAILAELRRQGISIRASDGSLKVRPVSKLPPPLAAAIRSEKAALLLLLAEPENKDDPNRIPDPFAVDATAPDPPFTDDEPPDDPEERSPLHLLAKADDRPAHSWPLTEEERQSARFIERHNEAIDRKASEGAKR